MPKVLKPADLAAIYEKTKEKIAAGDFPSAFIEDGHVIYRSINPKSPHTWLPKPAAGGHVSKGLANKLLIPRQNATEDRFSGHYNGPIPPSYALYFVLQQQALINEAVHYNKKVAKWALAGRCVLRMRTMGRILVADISPHNPGARRFFRELGKDIWKKVSDKDDCSVARGIGLAFAHSGLIRGIIAQTVRKSSRSDEERGDNLVLFAHPGGSLSNLYIDRATYYGKTDDPEVFPVDFP